jgi:isoleucyl-tRNA synthetase
MLLEGFDQHNRWFLSSLILSMTLTDEAPFKVLKTHGLLVDQAGDKISKSAPLIDDEVVVEFNPEDFLEGSVKMDGERKFGYGVDVMRAWCATKDTDKNMHIIKG